MDTERTRFSSSGIDSSQSLQAIECSCTFIRILYGRTFPGLATAPRLAASEAHSIQRDIEYKNESMGAL